MLYLIILFLYIIISKENYISKVTILIEGKGYQQILSNSTDCVYESSNNTKLPDILFINGIKQISINRYMVLDSETNNVTMIWNQPVTNCNNMFKDLINITYIDLSQFDSSQVTDMKCMFCNCTNLTSINLDNFNTSSVTNMKLMFRDCKKLKTLDLHIFNTSLVTNMKHMFYQCTNITSINVKSFDTSKVTEMTGMFQACYDLTSLDLSNFDTSSVSLMWAMFHLCKKLVSLDLSNFITSKITKTEMMFYECESLKFLNLNNCDTSEVNEVSNMFDKNNEKLLLCMDENKTSDSIKNKFNSYFNNNCSLLLCYLNPNHKLINGTNDCINKCDEHEIFRYEFNNICYEKCPNGSTTHNSSINGNLCECDKYYNYEYTGCLEEIPDGYYVNNSKLKTIDKCDFSCRNCEFKSNLCISCNTYYYPKFNLSMF